MKTKADVQWLISNQTHLLEIFVDPTGSKRQEADIKRRYFLLLTLVKGTDLKAVTGV